VPCDSSAATARCRSPHWTLRAQTRVGVLLRLWSLSARIWQLTLLLVCVWWMYRPALRGVAWDGVEFVRILRPGTKLTGSAVSFVSMTILVDRFSEAVASLSLTARSVLVPRAVRRSGVRDCAFRVFSRPRATVRHLPGLRGRHNTCAIDVLS
jgi:hypothetical protein